MENFKHKLWVSFFLVMSGSQIILSSCDEKLDHVDAVGQIIKEDFCSFNGKKAYVVDLDMTTTIAPKEIDINLTSDTIGGVRYNNLIRVIANFEAPDSLLYKYQLRCNLKPVSEKCPDSRFKIESFESIGEFGFSKVK
ncbi:hypothetical protein [Dyadobacter sp. 3J3]|uniref:hypothetical protein n=1 Tax=Dyadobacter sp. 3J3 TaxID=2606600 RepID=UPI001357102C|nr:hypothetical protein [Dyadobacter sp. 3J3]